MLITVVFFIMLTWSIYDKYSTVMEFFFMFVFFFSFVLLNYNFEREEAKLKVSFCNVRGW